MAMLTAWRGHTVDAIAGTTVTLSPSSGVPAGVLCVAFVAWTGTTTVTVTDTDGHTWTSQVVQTAGSGADIQIFSTTSTSEISTSDVVTATFSASTNDKCIALCTFSGWLSPTAADTDLLQVTGATSITTPNLTMGSSYNALVSTHTHIASATATNPRAGWTEQVDVALGSLNVRWQVQTVAPYASSAAEPASASWTGAQNANICCACFSSREYLPDAGPLASARGSAPMVNASQMATRY